MHGVNLKLKYIYENISLNSSYNEKCFRTKDVQKIKTRFCSINFFPEGRVFLI